MHHLVKSQPLFWRLGTRRLNLRVPNLQMSCSDLTWMRGYQANNPRNDIMPHSRILVIRLLLFGCVVSTFVTRAHHVVWCSGSWRGRVSWRWTRVGWWCRRLCPPGKIPRKKELFRVQYCDQWFFNFHGQLCSRWTNLTKVHEAIWHH